ncbi:MAG: YhjD/YihY/BrkB family envelope integrity protein [Pseudomonadota bacterium]|nr:YhjD/YihY/BrkB family envelope integrity protein [Pseudomonadota bacterium]
MKQAMSKIYNLSVFCCVHAKKVDCMGRSAILSFTSMFSLVPILVLTMSFISLLPVLKVFSAQVENLLLSHISVFNADNLSFYIRGFIEKSSDLSSIGFLFLFISSFLLFLEIETAFDKIWQVKKIRHGLISSLLHSCLLLLLPVMFCLTIFLEYSLPAIFESLGFMDYISPAFWTFSMAILIFSSLYKIIPSCHVKTTYAIVSGIFSSILFVVLKHSLIIYFSMFNSYANLYGAFAALPIFMLWLYCSWLIILMGAVLSYALDKFK